jgi:hypothetical protein
LPKAAQHPVLPPRLVVARDPHRGEQLFGDVDLPAAMHALIFAMRGDIALRLGAADHLLHVTPPDPLQRLSGQDVDMPGLGVHRGRRAFCHVDDFLDHGPGHRLLFETTHAFARLYQCLKVHSLAPPLFCTADTL